MPKRKHQYQANSESLQEIQDSERKYFDEARLNLMMRQRRQMAKLYVLVQRSAWPGGSVRAVGS